MTSVGKVVTTTYLYDVNDERIALGANGATTTYPFKLYNVNGNTIYKHIFTNGEPVADVNAGLGVGEAGGDPGGALEVEPPEEERELPGGVAEEAAVPSANSSSA